MTRIITALLGMTLLASCSFAQDIPSVKRIISYVSPSIVMVTHPVPEDKTMICTGFVVRAILKHVLTAQHCVVDDANKPLDSIEVDAEPATVIKLDAHLALLYAPRTSKPQLDIEKQPVAVGDYVYALGFGRGYPTALVRPVVWVFRANNSQQDAIAVDGVFIQGMSGGPVVSTRGKVVGMVQKGDEAMGYASGPLSIRAFLK